MHKFQTQIGTNVAKAAAHLRAGELVAIPTETVYGVAGNALREDVVLNIFKVKDRPSFNPLILHLASWPDATKYTSSIPEAAHKLAARFMPGPLTLLLPKSDVVPDVVTSGSNKVAVRIPGHPLTLQLLQHLDFPLAAPSANRYGYVSPVNSQHVLESLGGRIPYILDGGPCEVGLESTIVDFADGEVIIRRTGKISPVQLENFLGQSVLLETHAAEHPVAPGMLASHYATQTPLFYNLTHWHFSQENFRNFLLLGWGTESEIKDQFPGLPNGISTVVRSLSNNKWLDEVAASLFRMMRQADKEGFDAICVHSFPLEGIGLAIHDRLSRASFSHSP
jgi:L-threonylcarbamoyladenylate synthase